MARAALSRRGLLAVPAALAATAASAQQSGLVQVGAQGWLFPVWDKIDGLDQAALRDTVQVITNAVTALRAGRMDVVICLIPSRKRLMRQYMPAGARYLPEVERRYALPLAEARRAGALVPDLDAHFRGVMQREPGRQLFWKTDTHWTPVGAEVAAIEVARQMREQLGMPPSSRPGTRMGELRPMTLAAGDLARYAGQRGTVGSEESWIRQILGVEGPAALLDDDTTDVTVVGTSNVQPRFGFQPVLSNQILRPVGLFWKPNNLGPYFALLEYLKSEDFRRNRPRALVWNLLEPDMVTSTSSSAWGQVAMPPATFISEIRRLVGA
ncbi:alginate O-acetyltransferase AlgX-related protein [Roseococcus sp.]|uniref:alginate O-acetyltransferase AlgX-related protein n=1 Tax=Roseococcus sp. TaxID=2109646 RepID=UPI003BA9D064